MRGSIPTTLSSDVSKAEPWSWDGYVKRGRVNVRAGGSVWFVDGGSASHTQEIYDSGRRGAIRLEPLEGNSAFRLGSCA